MQTYLSQFDDIPGTTVFTSQRCRTGFHLNQFCMSLLRPANRAAFKADERAYLDGWKLTDAQRQAVLDRDYNRMIELGGNFYFLYKIGATDGHSVQSVVGGGRSPEGNRSKRENEQRLAA